MSKTKKEVIPELPYPSAEVSSEYICPSHEGRVFAMDNLVDGVMLYTKEQMLEYAREYAEKNK